MYISSLKRVLLLVLQLSFSKNAFEQFCAPLKWRPPAVRGQQGLSLRHCLLLSLNLMFYFTVSISLVISNPQGNMSLLLLNLNLMFYFTVSISRVISNSQCNIMPLLYCVVSAINHIFYIRCIPYGLVWIIMGLKIMSHVCHIKIWKKLSLVVYFPLILECWNRTMIINLLVTIVKYFPRGKLARDNYVR